MRRGLVPLAVLMALLATSPPIGAIEPVTIEVAADTAKPLLTGEKLPITVNLLTATTFASAVSFDLPTIPGAVLMQFGDRPTLSTRDQEGTSRTVQTYDLAFFALRPGTYSIPPFTARFSSPETFGGKPVDRALRTSPLAITANRPSGTESLPGIVCAKAFDVQETWSPPLPKTLRVGDSFQRTITSTAGDVPAMVFPPVPVLTTAELKAYPQSPRVEDRSERGVFTGKRVDVVTYVCQKPGKVLLPELVIPWWNLDDGSLQQIRLAAVAFEVVAAPHGAADPPTVAASLGPGHDRSRLWGTAGASLLLLSAATILLVRWRDASGRSPRSLDSSRLSDLLAACRRNDPARAHDALFRWAAHLPGSSVPTCEELAAADPSLSAPLQELERAVAQGGPWDGRPLARALRSEHNRARTTARRTAEDLPPLNP